MESEPEMEVNETPENLTEDNIGKTHDKQKKVEPEFDTQVKENSEKISEPVDSVNSHHDQTNVEENEVVWENSESSESSEQDDEIVIKEKT